MPGQSFSVVVVVDVVVFLHEGAALLCITKLGNHVLLTNQLI